MAATMMPEGAGPSPYVAVQAAPVAVTAEPEQTGVEQATLKKWFLAYVDSKDAEMRESRQARQYYHGDQWTAEERAKLRDRNQPEITNNRIALKIDGIVGVVDRLRMDPKATARTEAYAAGAEIGTSAVREVLDRNAWESLRKEVSEDLAVDGLGGVERDFETDDDGMPNVALRRVEPETYFYDPRSIRPDFSDARYEGVYKWLDLDAAIEMVPDRETDLRESVEKSGTFSSIAQQDWEKNWYDGRLERVKLVEIWYRHRGDWWFALMTGDQILKEGKSPFVDRRGRTRRKYRMASANIDQDGTRYGFVRNMKSSQDEMNHRRSKLLWMLNVNQFFYEEGSIEDPHKMRDLLGRPDAAIPFRRVGAGDGKPFELRDQSQQMQGQAELLAEAKGEIDNFGPNPSLLGSGPASASGRAQALQQQAGLAQLGPYFGRFKAWKLGLYRDLWADVRQVWQDERFVRVAGPEGLQFIPVNTLVMQDGVPRLANAIGDMDLDIVMDEGPDTVTVHEDVMQAVTAMIQQGLLSGPQALAATLELSALPPDVKQTIRAAGQPPQPSADQVQLQQTAQNLELRGAASKIAETEARTEKFHADALAAQARANSAGIEDQQHAVNTAATIADIAHKTARTKQIGAETAHAHMAALGVPALTATAGF